MTLALAIGANAVVFSLLNGLVLRPLNVPQSKSLVASAERDGDRYNRIPITLTCANAIAALTI